MRNCFVWIIFFIFLHTTSSLAQMVTNYEGPLGYTVAYDVASFTDVRDKTLEDVLIKMPSVAVGTRAISYNGMEVAKVFVNGTDIRSSYTMITGLKPGDVDKIEFVENFQAIEVLRGKQYSNAVAMNIVLKESGNSDWSGTAKLGSGWSPTLYDGDIYTIRIGAKSQNMFNFKADNTGMDLSGYTSRFVSDEIGMSTDRFSLKDYQSISVASDAALPEHRTRFNDSYLFNTANTFKVSDKLQLFVQASYVYDKNDVESSSETVFFMEEGSSMKEISGQHSNETNQEIKSNIGLVANTDKFYLSNHLLIKANLGDVSQELTGTYPNSQAGEQTNFTVRDDLRLMKPLGDWTFIVFSQNQIMTNPQNLSVARIGSNQYQDVKSDALFSDTKLSFGYTAGNWTFSIVGGFDAMSHILKTDLSGIDDFQVVNNDSKFGYAKLFGQPTANYVSDRLQLQVQLPIKYYHYNFDDKMDASPVSDNDIAKFEPSFSVKYQLTQKSSLTLTGEIEFSEANASDFYTGMVLTNYRNIENGYLKYDLDGEREINLTYAFRLPKYSFFINSNIGYSYGLSRYRSFDSFNGSYKMKGYLPEDTDKKEFNGMINLSKGVESLKGTIRFDVNYININQTMVRNNLKIDYNTQTWSLSPSINGRLTSWMKVVYNFMLNTTGMTMSNNVEKSTSTDYNQSLEVVMTPLEALNFSVLGEHYHTVIPGSDPKELFLADFKAEYQFTPQWQVILSITNLLDQKDYSYTSISDLSTTHYSYKIRPRNVLLSLYYKF